MEQQEFLNRLSEITAADLHVYRESGRKRPRENYRKDRNTPRVYSPIDINELITTIRDDFCMPSIRFVIDKDGLPFFGEEGQVIGSTPGHEEMCNGICRASGTLDFDEDYTSIIAINHSSGFFKPKFSSLFWSLNYLFSQDSVFKVAPKLEIEFSTANDSWQTITLNTSALREVVHHLSSLLADFSPDVERPFVTYSEEDPVVYSPSGIPCSGSYKNLISIEQPVTPPSVAQIGMFANQNNYPGIAAAGVYFEASSDEEEEADTIIASPYKKSRSK